VKATVENRGVSIARNAVAAASREKQHYALGYSSREAAIETEAQGRARERANLVAALERSGGKVYGSGGAAELLGVPVTTLASRLRALGIRRPPRGP
jgi:transcriptional regulator with GAF, ATPase, and Fis domain